jgi:hypothetical protein
MSKIQEIRVKEFNILAGDDDLLRRKEGRKHTGVIAQEIKDILPNAVTLSRGFLRFPASVTNRGIQLVNVCNHEVESAYEIIMTATILLHADAGAADDADAGPARCVLSGLDEGGFLRKGCEWRNVDVCTSPFVTTGEEVRKRIPRIKVLADGQYTSNSGGGIPGISLVLGVEQSRGMETESTTFRDTISGISTKKSVDNPSIFLHPYEWSCSNIHGIDTNEIVFTLLLAVQNLGQEVEKLRGLLISE